MMKITRSFLSAVILCGIFSAFSDSAAQPKRLTAKRLAKLENKEATNATNPNTNQQQTPPENNVVSRPNAKPNQTVPPRLQALVLDRFLDKLELVPDQKIKLREVRMLHLRQIRSLLELERAQAKVYDDVLYSNEFEAKQIEKRAADLAETRGEIIKTQARLFIEVRKILTPEQFAKLRQLVEEERMMRQKNTVQ